MNYFKEYERLKIYRKKVPIGSVWRRKIPSLDSYRYTVIMMSLSVDNIAIVEYEARNSFSFSIIKSKVPYWAFINILEPVTL